MVVDWVWVVLLCWVLGWFDVVVLDCLGLVGWGLVFGDWCLGVGVIFVLVVFDLR